MAGEDLMGWVMDQFMSIWLILKGSWYLIVAFIVALIIFLWKRKQRQYPLNCIIWERRGDDVITYWDKIGRFQEAGLYKWKFKATKESIPPERYDYVAKCAQGMGCAHFVKYGAGQYHIVDVRDLFKTYCRKHLCECFKINEVNDGKKD